MRANDKIREIGELAQQLEAFRELHKRIVHCHGVFDLLHVGHIKHLQAAREMGDILVVTVTPDRFVNKGPHRPAFSEELRSEALAALSCVDYVCINSWPTAVEALRLLKPDLYVKGAVKSDGKRDHTDAIDEEGEAVRQGGGKLVLTHEETFSASALINRHLDVFSAEVRAFLDGFRRQHDAAEAVECLRGLHDSRVLVLGEAIVDEYVFCDVIDKANKDPIIVGRHLYTEKYPGGALAIANHAAQFSGSVQLLSMLGTEDSQEEFVRSGLNAGIGASFVPKKNAPTIIKRRFLQEYKAVKLFEVYEMRNQDLTQQEEDALLSCLGKALPECDIVVVADYGHGMITPRVIEMLRGADAFIAVNTQANAGNRGFNTISKYSRADMVCIQESELRLEARDLKSDPRDLIRDISQEVGCRSFLLTRGERGNIYFTPHTGFVETPAFSSRTVDRIGAGDAVFAVASMCASRNVKSDMIGFVANIVGAEACMIMGNKAPVDRTRVFRAISSLLS